MILAFMDSLNNILWAQIKLIKYDIILLLFAIAKI